jgi:hypothetical protein
MLGEIVHGRPADAGYCLAPTELGIRSTDDSSMSPSCYPVTCNEIQSTHETDMVHKRVGTGAGSLSLPVLSLDHFIICLP